MPLQFELEFLAGVWKDSASVSLLWAAADDKGSEPLPDIEVPSWSWASRKGAIKHFHAQGKYSDNASTYITGGGSAHQSNTPRPLALLADLYSLQSGYDFGPLKKSYLPPELEPSKARYRYIERSGTLGCSLSNRHRA